MKKQPKPRKPYEKRVDLKPYQRLMRFLRWVSPRLTTADVLRMLPQSDAWKSSRLQRYVADLDRYVTELGATSLLELVSWIVIGEWEWPTKEIVIEGKTVFVHEDKDKGPVRIVRPPGLPHVMLAQPGFPMFGLERGEPVLLDGQYPTMEKLCRLADDLRDILKDLVEEDEISAMRRVLPRVADQLSVRVTIRFKRGAPVFGFTNVPQGYDFGTYCFWLLAQLIAEGHGWRVARCKQCRGFLVKTRRDPPGRPSQFCTEQCRRDWHNPRRPKKGAAN